MPVRAPLIRAFAALSAVLLFGNASPGPRFVSQYFYDENDSHLLLSDFKMLTADRGIATGVILTPESNVIIGNYDKRTPVALLTSDGGKHWDEVRLKAAPISVFFLNDTVGWFVAEGGIWKTDESGRSWKQISGVKELSQVYFLTESHGFAAGSRQRVLETDDGGVKWTPIAAAVDAAVPRDDLTYNLIAFNGPRGLVSGEIDNAGDIRDQLSWMDPAEASYHPQKHVNIDLLTSDGGKTWRRTARATYGVLTRAYFPGAEPDGLAVLQFEQSYPWPSELYHLNLANETKNNGVYREHNHAITDIARVAGGDYILAGYQTPGNVHPSVIPGKLRILRAGADLKGWTEIPADYRGAALRVWLAVEGNNVWAATDNGMILKLEDQ